MDVYCRTRSDDRAVSRGLLRDIRKWDATEPICPLCFIPHRIYWVKNHTKSGNWTRFRSCKIKKLKNRKHVKLKYTIRMSRNAYRCQQQVASSDIIFLMHTLIPHTHVDVQ